MMASSNSYKIAKNYAQALFDSSHQAGSTDHLYQSFSAIKNTLKEDTFLKKIMKNPLLKKYDQKNIISPLISKEVVAFFSFIIDKKRFSLLEEIADAFIEKVDTFKKVTRVRLETAHLLTQSQKDLLEEKLKRLMGDHTFHVDEVLNPHLLGGFRLKMKDKILDLSLAYHAQNILKGYHV